MLISRKMEKNLAESIDWSQTDLLITTPPTFQRILEHKRSSQQTLQPAVIGIDEADLLLGKAYNKNIRNSYKMLVDAAVSTRLRPIKHLLAAPTPECLGLSKSNSVAGFFSSLPKIAHPISEVAPKNIQIGSVTVEGEYGIEVEQQKLAVLERLLIEREGARVIVFCKKESVRRVKELMDSKFNRATHSYYADLPS